MIDDGPAWLAAFDPETLEPVPTERIDETRHRHLSDLVWRMRFRDGGEPECAYLFVLVEFLSAAECARLFGDSAAGESPAGRRRAVVASCRLPWPMTAPATKIGCPMVKTAGPAGPGPSRSPTVGIDKTSPHVRSSPRMPASLPPAIRARLDPGMVTGVRLMWQNDALVSEGGRPEFMTVKQRLLAAVAALVIAFGSLSAQADQPEDVPGDWRISMFGVENCVGALQNTGNELASASDCALEQVFSYLADSALQFVEKHGKAQLGEHFHIDRRLGLTASSGTLSADLDVVVPLTALSSVEDDALTRSFFMQNGVTRWRDAQGFQRSDVRLGFVHRYALFEEPGDGVLGTSMFVQENLERGHTRVVTGLEYLDRWGRGSLNYYAPVTEWLPGRYGYEERALAGLELSYGTELTNTINLSAGAGRWESGDGTGAWVDRGRLDIGWQPHPWFELRGGWDGIGTGGDSMAVHASVSVPLGVDWSDVRWEGLGRRDSSSAGPDVGTLWRSADHVGEIEVVEREQRAHDVEGESPMWTVGAGGQRPPNAAEA